MQHSCNRFFRHSILLHIILMLAVNISVAANVEVAKLPYDTLLQIYEKMSAKLLEGQCFYLRVYSDTPGIKSNEISLKLITGDEEIPVHIDDNGFITLPIRKDLVGKGAFIVTNQPKGSMLCNGEWSTRIPLKNQSIFYRDLMSVVTTSRDVAEIASQMDGATEIKHVDTLSIRVEQHGIEPVIISPDSVDEVRLKPDQSGHVLIQVQEKFLVSNPIVIFPTDKVFLSNKAW